MKSSWLVSFVCGFVACGGDGGGSTVGEASGTDGTSMGDAEASSTTDGADVTPSTETTEGPMPTTTEPPPDESTSDGGPAIDRCEVGAGEPALAVGHGGGSFAPFSTGDAAIVYGPQGGFHIDVALRAEYLDVSGAFLSEIRAYLNGTEVATGQGGAGFMCDPATLYQVRDGIFLIFLDGVQPSQVDDQTLQVEAELQDSAGTTVTASGLVTVVDSQ